MSVLTITAAVIGYLVFGFCLGIAREWAYGSQERQLGGKMREFWAFVFFPTNILVSTKPALIRSTGGGFLYWNSIALIWPCTVIYSIAVWLFFALIFGCEVLVVGICKGFPLLLDWGKLCKSCEDGIKRACGIS